MMFPFCASRIGALALAVVVWSLPQSARSDVSFTVTPAGVSNTYSGSVTLDIAGLTNGETVAIQKYIDANGNGAVDPGEPLADAFRVTDGGAFVINGVTNINVPFDRNPAPGAIATALNIAPPLPLGNLVGQFLFRLSSPVQNFPATNVTFTITNSDLGQSVSGVIYSNGVAPLPNAVVAILAGDSGRWVAGAIADDTGQFYVALDPGSYMLMPTFPGYFTDQSVAWQVTLTNGMSATNNLYLTNGTVTISGNVSDAGTGRGVGGILMPLDGANFFAITFTDTDGNYTAGVAPANWNVSIKGDQVSQHAYVASQNNVQVDTTTGSVANVNIALPKANALFYGTFTNALGAAMAGIDLSAQDNSNQYEASGTTDASGNYCVAVLGGTSQWYCSPNNSDPALAGYLVSSAPSTNLNVGQALRLNLTALAATARISGQVRDHLGNPVVNIGMNGFATINGVQYLSSMHTDDSGNYSLSASEGVWSVMANCCGSDGLDTFGLTDLSQHFVTIPPTNAVLNLTLYPYGTPVLIQPESAGTTFAFGLIGAPGTNYTIEVSTNLAVGSWSTLLVTNLTDNYMFFQDQITNSRRFYRALRGP